MIDFLLNQGLIFGPASIVLGLLFVIDWKWQPFLDKTSLELWLFAPLFACGVIALVGLPGVPPRETIETLIYIAPAAWGFAVISRSSWRKTIVLLLTNLHAYFVLQPLFADKPLWVLFQLGVLNGAAWLLVWSLEQHRGRWADGGRLLAILALGIGIFATGSFVLGQIQILAGLPFAMLLARNLLSGREQKPERFTYFGAVLPPVLLAEHLNYGF